MSQWGPPGARPKPDLPWACAGWAARPAGRSSTLAPCSSEHVVGRSRGKGGKHEGPLQRARQVGAGSGGWEQPGEAGGGGPGGARSASLAGDGGRASPRNRSPRSPPGDTEPATHRLQDGRNGWLGPARPHPGSRTQTALRERMVENRGPGPRAGRCRARGACSPSGPRGAGSGRTPACRSRAERPHAPAHTRPRLSVHSLPRSRPRCSRPPGSRRAARRLDPCLVAPPWSCAATRS